MAAHIGLDAKKEIDWISAAATHGQFAHGKIDAFLGFPPSRRSCAPAGSAA